MEKVRPWCVQPSYRGRLKNRTILCRIFVSRIFSRPVVSTCGVGYRRLMRYATGATTASASRRVECMVSRRRDLCVTVDDADDDNDAHARDRRDSQRQPAVLEAPRHDVTQKYRSRVLVVRVVVTSARHVAARAYRRPLGLQSLRVGLHVRQI